VSDVDRRGPVDVRLIRLVPALRTHLVVIGVVAAVTAIAVVVQAEALANGLTGLVTDGEIAAGIGALVVVLTSVAVVRGLATAVTEWSAARAMRAVRRDVRLAVLDHATLDADRSTGGLASREATIITSGVDQLEPYIRQFLPALTLALTVPLIAGVRILFADLLSAVLIALTVPLIPVFMVLIGRMTQRRTERQWAVLQRLGGHFLDVLEGMPTLRLFGRAQAQPGSVHDVSEQYRSTTMGALRIAFLSALALELIATLSVALIAVEIGLRLAGGSLDLGTALVVLLLTPECYLPLRRVGASFHAAQSGLDASDDLHELLSRPTLPVGDTPAPTDGSVVIRDLDLRRRGRLIVEGLDLDVAPGTITAVYGPSGVGKSTLIEACRSRVLERSGSITIGGIDVQDLEPAAWADQLTTIGQRLTPVASSVRDEVRAATGASDASVLRALADVGLADAAPRRADQLSGGQLRRVQVARALVAVRSGHARFVLADEPTAHLDAANADAVWAALAGLARQHGAAVLVATHDARCRSIADHIIDLAPSGSRSAPTTPTPTAPTPTAPATSVARADLSLTLAPAAVTAHVEHPGRQGAAVPGSSLGLRTALRRVLAIARPVRRRFIGAAALGTAAEVCTIGLAGAAAWLIVRAAEQPDLAVLSMAILGVRAFGTGKGAFRYAERLATHDAGLRSLTEIRAAVVARLADIAPAGIPGWQRGDMLQRVVADVDRLLDVFVRVLGPIVAVAGAALGALAIAIMLDLPAGLVLLTALVLVGVVVPALTVRGELSLGPALGESRAALGGRAFAITEGLDQLWANRMLGAARTDLDRVADDLDQLERRRARLRMSTGAVVTAAPLLTATATLATIAAMGGSLSGPVIGVLVLWPLAIVELVGTVNEAVATVPSIAGAAQRVVVVLDTPDPTTTPVDPKPVDPRPVVALDHVTARWPDAATDALAAVSMHLEPGAHATVTGPSGSGKSTLAAVLVGFLAPGSGTYRLGGADIGEMIGQDVRRRVTWIQQLPWIADSTVRENLRIADPAAGDDVLRQALHAVRLDEWFNHLPAGLDTQLGRGGSRMSGGEAQRLALARVLLAGHDVVVLDEPTANLDVDTAAEVLATVLDHCAQRTTILLGHGPESRDGDPDRMAQRAGQAMG
jgi:ATP-binding cassette, subfamily C, bacterial CydCD